ncbi:acyltransferase family protein [Aquimarina sp. I32.4]|uniref:acyltransferase family protein n=1 Tax=Aquimarina sp. I32.4 TaxID=2053903 RepID=UPI000CDEA995|nr:acyltransferase family protein [Aquimarina sp. I32.4]
MKTQPQKSERLHSLDSLRSIMMLLGLVIHSAITYGVHNYGNDWILKDTGAMHISNDLIVVLIHFFRMPIFFLVAGFFGSMLFYKRGYLKMMKNRISRIVHPFIVFILLLWPILYFSMGYTAEVLAGNKDAFAETIAHFSNPIMFIPQLTYHLWFLYYLILITVCSVLLALLVKKTPNVSKMVSKVFNWTFQKPFLRVIVFASLTWFTYLIVGTTIIEAPFSFVPKIDTFLFYFYFYIAGWVLFKSKHLLNSMMRLDWASTILGIISFLGCIVAGPSLSYEWVILLQSLIIWLFIFGIIGLFIRYGSTYSPKMRYISDASYWVYLVHLPLTAIIPGFLYDWDMPATIKFLTVLISTTTICFVTYHFLVRASFIGKFLNGRKYPNKFSSSKKERIPSISKPILEK